MLSLKLTILLIFSQWSHMKDILYSVFRQCRQGKVAFGGSNLGLSNFLHQKWSLYKVKIDSKIIIYLPKLTVGVCGMRILKLQKFSLLFHHNISTVKWALTNELNKHFEKNSLSYVQHLKLFFQCNVRHFFRKTYFKNRHLMDFLLKQKSSFSNKKS